MQTCPKKTTTNPNRPSLALFLPPEQRTLMQIFTGRSSTTAQKSDTFHNPPAKSRLVYSVTPPQTVANTSPLRLFTHTHLITIPHGPAYHNLKQPKPKSFATRCARQTNISSRTLKPQQKKTTPELLCKLKYRRVKATSVQED